MPNLFKFIPICTKKFLIKFLGLITMPVLALVGCFNNAVAMYMAPTYAAQAINIAISGKVMAAADSNTIQNIRLMLISGSYIIAQTNSASNGTYAINTHTGSYGTFTLSADDIDGTNNGSFQSQSSNIIVNGDTTTNIDFYLK